MAGLERIRNELAEVLKALGHPDRVRLVEELNGAEKDVRTLSESLGVRQARISQHLAVLRASHVVEDRREGRHVLYRLAKPALAAWIVLGGATLVDTRLELGEELNAPEEVRLVLEDESEEKDERKRHRQ
ncbi:MAG: metalloregulator ArsR/SmtB family transcription factor [Bryobacterales bacterium]|nr:metalloregulator ArsR/SmtB family transcription factor [Bryobacterales bacterium]